MAQRRMFSTKIVDSDAFLDMPLSTQALYFHLGMRADDDGFISNPKRLQRSIGATDDDLRLLLAKRFLLAFESGVVVVKHWKVNNYIQKDRYNPTLYQKEFNALFIKDNGIYTDHPIPIEQSTYPECTQNGYKPDTQVRLGKDRIGKKSINNSPEPKNGSEPTVAWLPLNTGEEYPISQSSYEEWKKLYPAVDIKQELNKMRGWCLSNPTKRKTIRGINKFINGWLSREQDKGGNRNYNNPEPAPTNQSRRGKKYKTILDEEGNFVDVEVTDEDG